MANGTDGKAIVFYDGDCAMCHGMIGRIVRLDRAGKLRFASQASDAFHQAFAPAQIASFPDSMVFRARNGEAFANTAAIIQMLRELGGAWNILAALIWLVPRPLRDGLYTAVQRRRIKWFGKTDRACPVVPVELRGRFLA